MVSKLFNELTATVEKCSVCGHAPAVTTTIHTVKSDNRALSGMEYRVWRCPKCGTIQSMEPLEFTRSLDHYSFDAQRESYFNRVVNRNIFNTFRNKFHLKKDDLFLAYGLKNNIFLNYLNKKINHFFGYDPYYPKYADKFFIAKRRYDFIFTVNDFGQFENPRESLREAFTLLNKGGIFCIQIPRADAIDLLNPDDYILELHAPYHRFIFTEQTMKQLAAEAGFNLILSTCRVLGDTPWPFVNTRLMCEYVRKRDNTLDALFDREKWFTTVLRHPELLFYGLFGYFLNRRSFMTMFFKKKVESVCRLCKGTNLEYVYKNTCEEMDLVRCLDCGLVYLDIRDQSTKRFYDQSYYPKEPLKFEQMDAESRCRNIVRFAKPGAKIFELGCGHGLLLRKLDKAGFDVLGNEFSQFAADYAENKLYLKVSGDTISAGGLQPGSIDLFCLYHVFEHLDDPQSMLDQIKIYLKPLGQLIIEVPHYNCAYSRWFGRRWFHLDLPKHVCHYDRKSLTRLLEQNGFIIRRVSTRYFLYDVFGNTLSFLNGIVKTQNVLNDKEVHLHFTIKDFIERPGMYRDYAVASCLFPFLFSFFTLVHFVFTLFNLEGGTLTLYAQKKAVKN